jgi:hypothetical protein
VGNLTAGNQKTAPNNLRSEPFSLWDVDFQLVGDLPLVG